MRQCDRCFAMRRLQRPWSAGSRPAGIRHGLSLLTSDRVIHRITGISVRRYSQALDSIDKCRLCGRTFSRCQPAGNKTLHTINCKNAARSSPLMLKLFALGGRPWSSTELYLEHTSMICFAQKMCACAGLPSRCWRQAIRDLGEIARSLWGLFNSFGTQIQATRYIRSSVNVTFSFVVIRCMNSSPPVLNERSRYKKVPLLFSASKMHGNLREDSSSGCFSKVVDPMTRNLGVGGSNPSECASF
jgi:hypothetical protein